MTTSGANKEERIGEAKSSDLSKVINQTALGCTMITEKCVSVCACANCLLIIIILLLYTVGRGLDNY